MKKKLLSVMLCTAMLCGMLAGCGGTNDTGELEEDNPSVEDENDLNGEDEEEEIGPEGMARSYLTGEWIDAELAAKRPVAVMLENTSASQPSYGISNADIIYEYPVEGGITRFMAIFQDYSGMDRIGSIRSSRPYYVYTAISYDAIYLHCGGSIETYNEILDLGLVDNIDQLKKDNGYYFRADDIKAPHNLYTFSDGIVKGIEELGYATEHSDSYTGNFLFNKDDDNDIVLENGADAAVVVVYQANPKPWFVYNEEDGLYYRYEFGKEQTDAATGEQLAVTNIIIQECPVETYYDEQDHDRVEVGILTGGSGKYITGGKAIDITWECSANGSVTRYYDTDGNEIRLNQGKTWVEIVDDDYSSRNVIYATYEDYQAAN